MQNFICIKSEPYRLQQPAILGKVPPDQGDVASNAGNEGGQYAEQDCTTCQDFD